MYKISCVEFVIFNDRGTLHGFSHEFDNWGYHQNVVLYIVFPHRGYDIFYEIKDYFIHFKHLSVPIYLIRLDFRLKLILAQLIDPVNNSGKEEREIYLMEHNGDEVDMFPSGNELISSRRLRDYSQNLLKLLIDPDYLTALTSRDCENHRYFISKGTKCFVLHGPLQVLQRRLNFTFFTHR